MKIAVLFDGAGLARLGLEQAGHKCIGVELNPWAHYLTERTGTGDCVLGDATKFNLGEFDAVWASPPCQFRATTIKDLTNRGGLRDKEYAQDYLAWSLKIQKSILWVENVTLQGAMGNDWGTCYNAAQFLKDPIQCRNRIIGGKYLPPKVYRDYKRAYPEFDICPTITPQNGKPAVRLTNAALLVGMVEI